MVVTPEEYARRLHAYNIHANDKEAAKALGLPPSTYTNWRALSGLPGKVRGPRRDAKRRTESRLVYGLKLVLHDLEAPELVGLKQLDGARLKVRSLLAAYEGATETDIRSRAAVERQAIDEGKVPWPYAVPGSNMYHELQQRGLMP